MCGAVGRVHDGRAGGIPSRRTAQLRARARAWTVHGQLSLQADRPLEGCLRWLAAAPHRATPRLQLLPSRASDDPSRAAGSGWSAAVTGRDGAEVRTSARSSVRLVRGTVRSYHGSPRRPAGRGADPARTTGSACTCPPSTSATRGPQASGSSSPTPPRRSVRSMTGRRPRQDASRARRLTLHEPEHPTADEPQPSSSGAQRCEDDPEQGRD